MRKLLIGLTLLASLLSLTQLAFGLEVPAYSEPATDLTGLLSSGQLSDLNTRLKAYRDQTGNEIAILIIQSLEGEALEDFSHKVFNTWGVGKANTDKGALFLMALNDKKTRIEVGYGLEADLTDSEAGRIVRRDSPMAESFRAQDWVGGINAVVDGIISGIGGEYTPAPTTKKGNKSIAFAIIPLFILIGIISAIGRMARFGGRRGGSWGPFIGGMGAGGAGWSGGSSGGGGGGFSFGGGSSGGGGASGGW